MNLNVNSHNKYRDVQKMIIIKYGFRLLNIKYKYSISSEELCD